MKNEVTQDHSAEFANMVNLISVYSEAANRIEELQAEANAEFLELLDDKKAEYAKLQSTLAETESALEAIALTHPSWFPAGRKSIKTPYGALKFHASTKIVIENEEVTIVLLEQAQKDDPSFPLDNYLKQEKAVNKEGLESMTDTELAQFRAKRVPNTNFSVVPAKVDMGKAVKADAQQEAA